MSSVEWLGGMDAGVPSPLHQPFAPYKPALILLLVSLSRGENFLTHTA